MMPILFFVVSFLASDFASADTHDGTDTITVGYSSAWFQTEQEWVDFWGVLLKFTITVFFFTVLPKIVLNIAGRGDK